MVNKLLCNSSFTLSRESKQEIVSLSPSERTVNSHSYLNLLFVFQANLIKMEMTVAIAVVMTPILAIWKMARKETRARGGRMPHNKGIREFLLELLLSYLHWCNVPSCLHSSLFFELFLICNKLK